ncbi:MAG: hypothetical protein QM652_07390 [Legionella sp.]|uniref:hypothetical protein n=1 Tax=Legionella sp. TaxID=459 RepID=UPI0039E2F65E
MSYYTCVDLINERLDQLHKLTPSLKKRIFHFFSKKAKESYLKEIEEEKNLLWDLKTSLLVRSHKNDYTNLQNEMDKINNYGKRNSLINYLYTDLHVIDTRLKDVKIREKYSLFLSRQIAEPFQGDGSESYRLGLSKGECYGFTFAMVDPELSPYEKCSSNKKLYLNRKIHNYQKNQTDRHKDQTTIKRKRLTRELFCPDFKKQAEKIFAVAEKNVGKEIMLGLRCAKGKHACYLSLQIDGKIRYMDPNYGAYLFHHEKEFIDFYITTSEMYKAKEYHFKFYQIVELIYDKTNQLVESRSWAGKIRSLLTGNKYSGNSFPGYTFYEGLIFVGFIVVYFIVIASLIISWSNIPIAGLLFGLGAMLLGDLGARALNDGHRGLLAISHYLQERGNNFNENKIKPLFNFFIKKISPTVKENASFQEICGETSVAKILLAMPPGKWNPLSIFTQVHLYSR